MKKKIEETARSLFGEEILEEQPEEEKSSAFAKMDIRLLLLGIMGVVLLFSMGWGICQMVRSINTRGELTTYEELEKIKKVEDNSQNEGKTIDVEELVRKVLDNVAFEAELNKLDDSVAEGMVATAGGTKLLLYVGNGTYADELLVMAAGDEDAAKQNQKNAEVHLAETKEAFQDYIPKEAEKIDKAVSVRCGCYVIVCVTADYETAEKVINDMIRE